MFALSAIGLLFVMTLSANAQTITVTSTADSGPGSLRDAIANASSGETINFNLPSSATITLTSGPLMVGTSLTISGPGASNLAVSGNSASQVFVVAGGVQVSISNLTVENGMAPYCAYGGGISNSGTLTLTQVVMSGNVVGYSPCTAPGGGAIVNGGTLILQNSTLTGNSAYRWGGGINNGGIANVVNSTFVNNSGLDGAAFFNSGTLTVTGSTFYQNSAGCGAGGGGVIEENNTGKATFFNSTMVSNSACLGGAISDYGGQIQIAFSTLSGNAANYQGGSLYGGPITIKNSILANSPLAGNCSVGSSTSGGFNLSDDDSCSSFLTATGDMNGVSAYLDPNGLQNNGGPTQTIALVQGSPAIDAIPVADCTDTAGNPVTVDQRGISRPQGPACDIGAYELVEGPEASTSSAQNFNGTPIAGGTYIWFNSNFTVSGAMPTRVELLKGSITFTANGTSYTVPVPNATITFSSSASCATTTFAGGSWQATLPTSGTGDIFLGGVAFPVPASGLPGGIKNVTWSGTIQTDVDTKLQWKWGAAVYNPFSADYNSLGVKPTHQDACNLNDGDQAGSPEQFGPAIGGATGGGAANLTGGWSGTVTVSTH